MSDDIPISEQANVPGGLMSLDPGTVPGKRPPNFGKQEYSCLVPLGGIPVGEVHGRRRFNNGEVFGLILPDGMWD
jgi:hypothetical protein